MFTINPAPLFTADVQLTVPGKSEPVTVKMTFKYKTREELLAFEKKLMDKKTKAEDALGEIVESWEGIDVPCTQENMKLLASNYVAAPAEIIAAYNKELVQSKVKN